MAIAFFKLQQQASNQLIWLDHFEARVFLSM
jgi:hypothetical protein